MLNPILLLLVVLLIKLMVLLDKVTLEQENSLLKGIIEKCVYKSLARSKQFEETQARKAPEESRCWFSMKVQCQWSWVGRRSIPQDEVCSSTREVWSYFLQGDTSSRWSSTTRPQAKRQGQASRGDWCIWRSSKGLGQVGSQVYLKFYFIKYIYNPKDSHQDDVNPKEEELESSWGWLRQHISLIFILARTSAITFHILH